MKKIAIALALILSVLLLTSCSLGGEKPTTNSDAQTDKTSQNDAYLQTPSGKAPGLYNQTTGDIKYTWAELEVRGFVTVKENFITDAVNYLIGDLYIPNGVLGISKSAFSGCTGLTGVFTGNGMTTIGTGAFSSCTGLISVELGTEITNISNKAFNYCTRLEKITIPNSVTNIGASAFAGCTGLLTAHVGDGVTNISKSAFSGCTGLESIRLGKNITYIGTSVFKNCEDLSVVDYNGTRNEWGAILIDKKNEELYNASLITTDPPVIEENNEVDDEFALNF